MSAYGEPPASRKAEGRCDMKAYEIISILIDSGMLVVSLLAFLDMRNKNKSDKDE
jgi:hypothetical protein